MSVLNDASGRPYKVHLCKTDISQNNNKFYDMELYEGAGNGFTVKMINGRIGYRGVTHFKEFRDLEAAAKFFNVKFREKTSLEWAERDAAPVFGKYVVVELADNAKKEAVEPKKEEPEPEPENVAEQEPVKAAKGRGRPKKVKKEEPEEEEPEGHSFVDERVKDLMKCICDEDVHLGLLKQLKFNEEHGKPIDCLSLAQLETGYEILAAIEKAIGGRNAARSSTRKRAPLPSTSSQGGSMHDTNKYYSLIPHSFGFQVPPRIDTLAKVQAERDLLDALKGSIEAAQSVKDVKAETSKKDVYHRLYERLPCQLEQVSAEVGEKIGECLQLRGPTHAYKVSYINAFELKHEALATEKPPKPAKRPRRGVASEDVVVAEKRLLWHGTRVTNVFSILMNGLVIPDGDRYGLMFGNGVYFANMPTKSANYCSWEASRRVFMFLCEVDVSNPLVLYESEVDAVEKIVKEKKASVYAAGLHRPTETVDINGTLAFKSGLIQIEHPTELLYDEYVMFDTQKWRIKYVVEVKVEKARI